MRLDDRENISYFFEKKDFDTAESPYYGTFRHCNEAFGV
jgi:hypothetical protein